MRFRKLRITLPAICLVIWMASYCWYIDTWCGTRYTAFRVGMLRGEFQVAMESIDGEYSPPFVGARIKRVRGTYSDNSDVRQFNFGGIWATWMLQDQLFPELHCSLIGCNFVWLFALSLFAAAIPYANIPSRFNLRTLLIAMTLVAVALGAIVLAATK